MRRDVFISHKGKACWAHARLIAEHLKRAGLSVFLDVDHMGAGTIAPQLERSIQRCRAFVVVLTRSALKSIRNEQDWVVRELGLAMTSRRRVIPVFFDGSNLATVPRFPCGPLQQLKDHQAIRVERSSFAHSMDRLVSLIRGRRRRRGSPSARRDSRVAYQCVAARERDLADVRNFARRAVRTRIMTMAKLRRIHRRNPATSFLVVETASRPGVAKHSRIVGLFCVLPLTRTGVARIERVRGASFRVRVDDVARPRNRAWGLYIAIVCAEARSRPRERVLLALSSHLAGRVDDAPRVYAKPATADGRRLVERHRFMPLDGRHGSRGFFRRDFTVDPLAY